MVNQFATTVLKQFSGKKVFFFQRMALGNWLSTTKE
jgi:hypothetical protein